MLGNPPVSFLRTRPDPLGAVEWRVSAGLTAYAEALAFMEARAAAIAEGVARECVWLIEHPPLYTAGTSTRAEDRHDAPFPVHEAGRGGQLTYHGPGQRVVYVMLDLRARQQDVRAFVRALEAWIIATLGRFALTGFTDPDRVGVWVRRPDKGAEHEDKIAAIGIRLRKWVSFHGLSLNVAPDLAPFSAIVPCGIRAPSYGVTSLADLGVPLNLVQVDAALKSTFEPVFGPLHGVDRQESPHAP